MDSSWLTTDLECVKKWSEAIYREAQKQRWLNKFVSTKPGTSIFCEKTDLNKTGGAKGKGDEVTFTLVKNLVGAGVIDHNQMEGNEEPIVTYSQKVRLRIRRNATQSDGELSEKRVVFDFRDLSRTLLGGWAADEEDSDMLYALSGLANPAGTIDAAAPSAARKWFGGQTTEGVVTSVADVASMLFADVLKYKFGSKVLEVIRRKAMMASPKIPPVKLNGKPLYVYFAHPYQIKALRAEAAWTAAHNAVGTYKNPLFTGADSYWDGVVVHEWEKIETRLGDASGLPSEYFEAGDVCADGVMVARGLFCGLDAGVIAHGRRPKWVEQDKDYEMKHGICVSLMAGIKKTEFNDVDNGVIVVNTVVTPDA